MDGTFTPANEFQQRIADIISHKNVIANKDDQQHDVMMNCEIVLHVILVPKKTHRFATSLSRPTRKEMRAGPQPASGDAGPPAVLRKYIAETSLRFGVLPPTLHSPSDQKELEQRGCKGQQAGPSSDPGRAAGRIAAGTALSRCRASSRKTGHQAAAPGAHELGERVASVKAGCSVEGPPGVHVGACGSPARGWRFPRQAHGRAPTGTGGRP